jgi:hypothetical protein
MFDRDDFRCLVEFHFLNPVACILPQQVVVAAIHNQLKHAARDPVAVK